MALLIGMSAGSLAQANNDTYRHIDQLAQRIERKAKAFKGQMSKYRHTPEYQHLINDAIEMCRLAEHVHEVAHVDGDVRHLAADLRNLDRTFHHIEGLVQRIEHDAAYGHGHVHGNTRYVWKLLQDIEESIHHMRDDIADLRRRRVPNTQVRGCYDTGYNVYGSGYRGRGNIHGAGYGSYGPGYGYGGRGFEAQVGRNVRIDSFGRGGITLGSGGTQFRIGF